MTVPVGAAAVLVGAGLTAFFVGGVLGYPEVSVLGGVIVVGVGAIAMIDGGLVYRTGETVVDTANGTATTREYAAVSTVSAFPLGFVVLLLGSAMTLRGINGVAR